MEKKDLRLLIPRAVRAPKIRGSEIIDFST